MAELTKVPIFLAFLHIKATPTTEDLDYGCPPVCPTGLFVGELCKLKDLVREDKSWAKGMAYWGWEDLTYRAPVSDFEKFAA